MKILQKAGSLILLAIGTALSCMGPMNVQGVALNSGETINFAQIETLGDDGIAYLKEVDGDRLTYKFQSSLSPHVMVYVSNRGVGGMSGFLMNTVGIKIDSTLYYEFEDDNFDTSLFNFTACLMTELDRLNSLNILSLSSEELNTIREAFGIWGGQGLQYWTFQNDVLMFNSWFEEVNSSNIIAIDGWGSKSGVAAKNQVSSNDVGDGCSGTLPYDLPFGQLGGATSVSSAVKGQAVTSLAASLSSSSITLNLPSSVRSQGKFELFTVNGRRLVSEIVPVGASEFSLPINNNITAQGVYVAVLNIDGISHKLMLKR